MSAIPDQLIARIEAHIECWKQFNNFAIAARASKFRPEDESHFLELKKIIAQDAETIFTAIEVSVPPPPGRKSPRSLPRAVAAPLERK